MNERERFIYYAKSNGIDPAVLGHKITSPYGKLIITGQRNHSQRPIVIKTYTRKMAISVPVLRKYMMKDKNACKFLIMESEQVNSNLWFEK